MALKVISLFSGAGGIDLGLVQAGLEIVWAVDNDNDSVETYRKNIGDHVICKDIAEVSSKEIPNADIIIGGFPCQGFSMANRFRTKTDGRNKLYEEMLRIIKDKQPKWFVAENVKGILSLDGGRIFKKIIEDFNKTGYNIKYKLVNMADHGVPQTRKRILILGTRNDLSPDLEICHPEPTHSEIKSGLKKWVSINEALRELKKYKSFPNDVGSKYKTVYRNFIGHRKTDGNKPSPTILARGNGKGGVCAIPHPTKKIRLTIRESAMIQTFPIDFEFCGKVNSMYRQIGNAIPVLYGKKLGEMFNNIAKKRKNQKVSPGAPTVVSLFSGAGGMDLGFSNAGFNIIWANDNQKDFVETYKKNFGEHIVLDGIENVNLTSIPQADVVIGGFPCQGFSVANMKRSVDDSRNKLYRYFTKVIKRVRPKVFVAENVKGILNIGSGKVFEKIIKDFSDAGYNCKHTLLNAANYGVPQSRERVFIIGVRKDLDVNKLQHPPAPTHADKEGYGFKKIISIGEALRNIPDHDENHDLKNHVYTKHKVKYNGYISNRKVNPDKPSPTITARGDHKGGAMIIHHPYKERRLSCRELAIIQGFPLDFEFCGSMTSVYIQIGNAVPPPLSEVVADSIQALLSVKNGDLFVRSLVPKTVNSNETKSVQAPLFSK